MRINDRNVFSEHFAAFCSNYRLIPELATTQNKPQVLTDHYFAFPIETCKATLITALIVSFSSKSITVAMPVFCSSQRY